MVYRIEIKSTAARDLRSLPRSAQVRVARKIDSLARHVFPRGCWKLAGMHALWRIRVGDYRVAYTVRQDPRVILVLRIKQRGGA
jgi:mRNA interferase RelE/StbE